jgi:hypothetical protein
MGERFPAAFHSGQQALFLFNHTADHNGISDGFAFLNAFPRTTSTLNTVGRSSPAASQRSPPLVALEAVPSSSPVPGGRREQIRPKLMQRRHVAHRRREYALRKALRATARPHVGRHGGLEE